MRDPIMRGISDCEIRELTFTHASHHLFEVPDYQKILENISPERHEKTSLGLWSTVTPDLSDVKSFGRYIYQITLKPEARVLRVGAGKLKSLYYEEGHTTKSLREKWKDIDMVWLDGLEQIFLKFDNINIERLEV